MTAIQPMRAIFPGSSLNVTCLAEFDDTVDVPLIVNITFGSGEELIDSDYPVHMESYTRYARTFTIKNIRESQEYTCAFLLLYSELSALYILMHQNDSMASVYAYLNVSISKL